MCSEGIKRKEKEMGRFMTFLLTFNKSRGLEQAGIFLVLSAVAYSVVVYGSGVEVNLLYGHVKLTPYRGSLKVFVEILAEVSKESIISGLNQWFIEACEKAFDVNDAAEIARRLECTELETAFLLKEKHLFKDLFTFEETNDLVKFFEAFIARTPDEKLKGKIQSDLSSGSSFFEETFSPSSLSPLAYALLQEASFLLRNGLSGDRSDPHVQRYHEILRRLEEM